MSRLFTSTRVDPRRLSMQDHQRARQTPGERRRIHGPIQPMHSEGKGGCTTLLGAAAIALAAIWILIPGAAWLAIGAP